MKPYYEDDAVTLYLGDADSTAGGAALLEQVGPIGHIITDPPYNVSTRNGRDGTTVGTLKRKDGTSRKVQRNFGDWDHTWHPGQFLTWAEANLPEGGSLVAVRRSGSASPLARRPRLRGVGSVNGPVPLELSEDDAKLLLDALSAYRWVLMARTGHDDGRITDLSARIIWREGQA